MSTQDIFESYRVIFSLLRPSSLIFGFLINAIRQRFKKMVRHSSLEGEGRMPPSSDTGLSGHAGQFQDART